MSKQDYTPYNIYQKRKMAESATPLKSIYAQNSNMFLNAVPEARSAMDRGHKQFGGDEKIYLPSQNKGKKDQIDENKKKEINLSGDGEN
jgi:hypothetical protein